MLRAESAGEINIISPQMLKEDVREKVKEYAV